MHPDVVAQSAALMEPQFGAVNGTHRFVAKFHVQIGTVEHSA